MARVPTATRTATDDQVLAVLRDHMPLPLPTQTVAVRANLSDHATYLRLARLHAAGRVTRHHLDGWRCVFWALPGSVLDA